MTNGQFVKYPSRKWKLVLLVVILATIGAFLPPLASIWLFCAEKPLVILSGTEWVSIVTMVASAYFGVNVWQKHVEKKPIDPSASGVGNEDVTQVVESNGDDKEA